MMTYTKRKDILDNNNYIGKYGKITHVCPSCGNIYSTGIKLNVNCEMTAECCELDNYIIHTPSIDRKCPSCNCMTIQVDNAMGPIIQTLFMKGYNVFNNCEGHMYIKCCVPVITRPFIVIEGPIKALIPSVYYNKLDIDQRFNYTKINGKCKDDWGCMCTERFKEYKSEVLELITLLVKSLPDCPFNNKSSNADGCGCGNCDCVDK